MIEIIINMICVESEFIYASVLPLFSEGRKN